MKNKKDTIKKRGKSKSSPCIFCQILKGKAPGYRIYEDDLSLGLLDINPFTQGHCLVISKRHTQWWHDLTEKETQSLFRVARIIAHKIKKAFQPDFVCMYARGRRIPHTHLFLVPTFAGDLLDRFFNALEKIQESPLEMAQLHEKKSMEKVARLLQSVPSLPSHPSEKKAEKVNCEIGPKRRRLGELFSSLSKKKGRSNRA